MPSTTISTRPYTTSPNGELVWEWEKKNYKIKIKEDIKMPFKKQCYFCRKLLTNKVSYIDINGIKKHVCSMCEYLFKVISREYDNGRDKVLARIISSITTQNRNCDVCRYFDFHKKYYCKKGMWTGVEKNQHEYPNSFANAGCGKYTHF